MDKLVITDQERFRNPEAFTRDCWVRDQARSLPPGSIVLDAGAGSSKYRPLFEHCQYRTQDFCQYQGELVRYLQPIDYVCDITSIPLKNGSMDAILCTETFEHVIDPMAVLAEFARLIRPGGRLFLTAPLLSHLHMEPYHFYGGFTHYWYRHWLPARGFQVDSITPIGGPGRTWAIFGQSFYWAWAAAERRMSGPGRWLSYLCRGGAKPVIEYFLPWFLPKFDAAFGNQVICSGYMVAGTRLAGSESKQ